MWIWLISVQMHWAWQKYVWKIFCFKCSPDTFQNVFGHCPDTVQTLSRSCLDIIWLIFKACFNFSCGLIQRLSVWTRSVHCTDTVRTLSRKKILSSYSLTYFYGLFLTFPAGGWVAGSIGTSGTSAQLGTGLSLAKNIQWSPLWINFAYRIEIAHLLPERSARWEDHFLQTWPLLSGTLDKTKISFSKSRFSK